MKKEDSRGTVCERLKRCRAAYEDNKFEENPAALWDALTICEANDVPLERWMYAGLRRMMWRYVQTLSQGTGRHARWLVSHEQEMADLERYELARYISGGDKPRSIDFEIAEDELRQQGRITDRSTIRKSHDKVAKNPDKYFKPTYFSPLKSGEKS